MKEYITFETAKLLKHHEETENYFKYFSTTDPSWYIFHDDYWGYDPHKGEDFLIQGKDKLHLRYKLMWSNQPEPPVRYDSWPAPQLSDVRRFLREEHCFHISIQPYMISGINGTELKYKYDLVRQVRSSLVYYTTESDFESYEDAMNQGLFKSLKLLEED